MKIRILWIPRNFSRSKTLWPYSYLVYHRGLLCTMKPCCKLLVKPLLVCLDRKDWDFRAKLKMPSTKNIKLMLWHKKRSCCAITCTGLHGPKQPQLYRQLHLCPQKCLIRSCMINCLQHFESIPLLQRSIAYSWDAFSLQKCNQKVR